jgi:hypothetical protein
MTTDSDKVKEMNLPARMLQLYIFRGKNIIAFYLFPQHGNCHLEVMILARCRGHRASAFHRKAEEELALTTETTIGSIQPHIEH